MINRYYILFKLCKNMYISNINIYVYIFLTDMIFDQLYLINALKREMDLAL